MTTETSTERLLKRRAEAQAIARTGDSLMDDYLCEFHPFWAWPDLIKQGCFKTQTFFFPPR